MDLTRIADALIARADTEEPADAAKIPALGIGWYHQRYGDVPQEEPLRLVRRETLGEEGKRPLLHAMQKPVSTLAEVMGVKLDGGEKARH